ncbi:hypothetical protein BSKO_11101 [Bryopsis sp. KO-2023]|nr:hypothetical protein BSKO_11101 [Bryopsis sp. KO-2023]
MVRIHTISVDTPDIFPGGVVAGHVLLIADEQIQARAVRLTLVGKERVHITRRRSGKRRHEEYTFHYHAEKEIINETVTLFGWPVGVQGGPVFLEAGRQYFFPFTFKIPSYCLPSCKHSAKKNINYRLESCVDRPWKLDFECKQSILVLPNAHMAPTIPNYYNELELRHYLAECFCFRKGCVKVRIQLEKPGYWWLENVPVEVVVDNSLCSALIRRVGVQYLIVSTYLADGKVDTFEHELAGTEFCLRNGHIPAKAGPVRLRHLFDHQDFVLDQRFPTSTIHGKITTHKFVIRANVVYKFGGYATELPIFAADGPARPSDPNQSVMGGMAVVNVEKPPKADKTSVDDYGFGLHYLSLDSGDPDCCTPGCAWPDDESPVFERTGGYGVD